MKRTVGIVLVVGMVTPAAAQQKLSEVAGSIELRTPSDRALMVEAAPAPEAGGRPRFGGTALEMLSEDFLERTREAAGLLAETATNDSFYSASWRERMLITSAELEGLGRSLELGLPHPRYQTAYERVMDGVAECQTAIDVVRDAIARDHPVYSVATQHLEEGDRVVSAGLEQIRRIQRAERAEENAPPDDAYLVSRAITELCGARFQDGGTEYDRCAAEQRAGFGAIGGRFNFTVGLDEPTFNAVRNICRSEFPADFAARNRCELQRMAAALPPE
jgi:hypothetical protein